MFDSAVLDVAVGIIYTFLMVSLICTAISSKVTEWLNWRAKFLEQKIRELLMNGDQNLVDQVYNSTWVKSLVPNGAKPTNIPTKTFALAVFDVFVPNASGVTTVDQLRANVNMMGDDMPLKKEMLAWLSMVANDMNAVRTNIENWFNAAEKTMTDTYSRNLWKVNLIIGLVVSLFFNVDTLAIGTGLWRDSALRQVTVTAANRYMDQSISSTSVSDQQKTKTSAQKAAQELNNLRLPMGWDLNSMMPNDWLSSTQIMLASGKLSALPENDPMAYILKLFGWLITAFAGAQGAPFWFDALRQVTRRT